MREWSYKKDESGRPRRFLDHRESVSWIAVRVGKFTATSLAFGLIMLILFYREEFRLGVMISVIAVALVLCAAAVAVTTST